MQAIKYTDNMRWPQWPYVLKLQFRGAHLLYFGEAHSNDPDFPQWQEVKKLWAEFLKATDGTERIMFVEGGLPRLPNGCTESAAIHDNGGAGLGEWLARDAGIPVESPEPPETYERAELEKQFTRDEIQYYYFARVALQWQRLAQPRMQFDQYIQAFLNADKKYADWEGYDFSLEHMKLLHQQFTGKEIDLSDEVIFYDQSNPANSKSVGGMVASNTVRDEYIAAQIVSKIKSGTSVFAIYGGGHVVVQEPLLRELLA
jgi:hypothetical protein